MFFNNKLSKSIWLIVIGLMVFLAACDGSDSTSSATNTPEVATDPAATVTTPTLPTETPEETVEGVIYVETLEVAVMESFPAQVQATVSGNLSDGCTSLEETTVHESGTAFTIVLSAVHDDTAVCTQALVPFEETVSLDVVGLPAGTYSVQAEDLVETFTLEVDNSPQATPDLDAASLTISQNRAEIGSSVSLMGNGFPANAAVEIGFGRVNSEYDIVSSTQAGEDGSFSVNVVIPEYATPQDEWVFVADVDNAKVITDPILIVESSENGSGSQGEVNVPNEDGLFTRTRMYLIALEDGGDAGPKIGCEDSVVPVEIEIEPTVAPLTAALEELFSVEDEFYGQSGLYNSLADSDLAVEGINIEDGEALISLTGSLQLGGVCDNPRVLAQIEYTALQYETIDSVTILLNGQSLESQLEG